MNAPHLTDAQVSQALRAHLPDRAQAGLRERILEAAETTGQQRPLPWFLGALSEADSVTGRRRSLLVAAALLLALAVATAAAVGALRLLQRDPIRQMSVEPPAVVTPTVRTSPGPSSSPTPTPIVWTEARLEEDWPAPVRAEPAGGAIVKPLEDPIDGRTIYPDPSGDTGSSVLPWVDIREVRFGRSKVTFGLVSSMPPSVDPTEQWIAYGVVVDDDRDGVPDWRYGMDNMPVDATGERPHRAWRTNLHTGRTESAPGGPYEYVGDTYFDTYFLDSLWGGPTLSFGGGDLTGGGTRPGGLVDPFYAWAAVIENGRVVATDYAPDVGWLDPSVKTKP